MSSILLKFAKVNMDYESPRTHHFQQMEPFKETPISDDVDDCQERVEGDQVLHRPKAGSRREEG